MMHNSIGSDEQRQELFSLLKLMSELGLTIKTETIQQGNHQEVGIISSFNKDLLHFLAELQPKVEKPTFNPDTNYYLEFWKIFLSNEILLNSLKEIALEKVLMEQKVKEYEQVYTELENQVKPKKKKRRTAKEIQKNYMCPYTNCKKKYGSNVSLNLHIKRIHSGGNKSEREKYAVRLLSPVRRKCSKPSDKKEKSRPQLCSCILPSFRPSKMNSIASKQGTSRRNSSLRD
jgi:hypothetical protein